MIKRLLLILICLPLLGQGYNVPFIPRFTAPTCTTDISLDEFTSTEENPIDGDPWDQGGDTHASCPWSTNLGSNGFLRWESNDQFDCDNLNPIVLHTDTLVSNTNNWACYVYEDDFSSPNEGGPIFRADTQTETTSWYRIGISRNSDVAGFWDTRVAGVVDTCTVSADLIRGARFCAHITGTGEDILVSTWMNPTGNTPEDFGPADCILDPTGMTDNAGDFVGLGHRVGNTTANGDYEYESFVAGSCS